MSGLVLTITEAGRAALVNAANTGTEAVLLASVGVSAASFTPSPAATSLPGEIKRISTIAGEAVADDTVHVTVRDESNAVYTVRSFGLYLSDGTLFAVYSQPEPIMEKSAQAMLLLALDVAFADIDADQITFGDTSFLNPPATTERQGVVELATPEETATGSDATRAVHPRGLKAAVTGWLNARFGEGAPSDFIKGLLNSASAAALRLSLGLKSAALKDEGAGKGLDADLLDGQHGSYYSNVVARLGYTPWGPNNDGAGSGLDADLLDGQQGSYYADIPARLGYTPANRAGDTFTGDIGLAKGFYLRGRTTSNAATRLLGLNPSTNILYFGGIDQPIGDICFVNNGAVSAQLTGAGASAALRVAGHLVWHAGNDGAGSGLDADLFDGKQSSEFLGSNAISSNAFYGANVLRNGWYGILFGEIATAPALIFDPSGRGGLYSESNGWRWHWDGSDIQIGGTAGRKAWHSANDGSGSGLDADLWDGEHRPVNFARVAAGGSPLDSTTDPMTLPVGGSLYSLHANNGYGGAAAYVAALAGGDIGQHGLLLSSRVNSADLLVLSRPAGWTRVWTIGNDGAGSGLDADLLDGQQGSYYLPASSYTAADVRAKLLTVDGSGSGLDADLLDGLHAADFAKLADFIASKTTNGYCRLPNGMILQAGRFSAVNDSTVTVTFPIAFPNMCMGVVVSGTAHLKADAQDNNPAVRNGSVTLTSFQVFNAADTTQAFFLAFGW